MLCVRPSFTSCLLSTHQLRALITHPKRFELAFVDSGASKMITPFREDFASYNSIPTNQRESIDGFTSDQSTCSIGKGIVRFEVLDSSGVSRILEVPAIHVPDATARLFSPQWFSQHHPTRTQTIFGVDNSIQFLDEGFSVPLSLDLRCNLPVLRFRLPSMTKACSSSFNLSGAQRLLLHWHNKLGHIDFRILQSMAGSRGIPSDIKSCPIPICSSCINGKQHKRPRFKSDLRPVSSGKLNPGQFVSIDQFISRLPGRGYNLRQRLPVINVVTVYVDAASKFIYGYLQHTSSVDETLMSKRSFEGVCSTFGVSVSAYHADNGAFASDAFKLDVTSAGQVITYCGVGAHHQNPHAERTIRTITEKGRTFLWHSKQRWPTVITDELWSFALLHAIDEYNITPSPSLGHMCPIEVFSKSKLHVDRRQQHVWGCPCYVLEPRLQSGGTLPKWSPRSRRAVYLGRSACHATNVALVMNCKTGNISPQFHVIFDDTFSTATVDSDTPPSNWNDLFRFERSAVPCLVSDSSLTLDAEWLSDESFAEDESHIAIDLLSSNLPPESSSSRSSPSLPPSPPIATPPRLSPNEGGDDLDMFPVTIDSPCSAINRIHSTATNLSTALDVHVHDFDQLHNQVDTSLPECASVSSSLSPKRTRSGCAYTTVVALARPTHHRLPDSSFLASVAFNAHHPFACVATTKYNNDNPSYSMALNGPNRLHFIAAMEAEHEAVKAKDTYDLCSRDDLPPHTTILPVIWVFRVKRRPDGSILKYKARICVRGIYNKKASIFPIRMPRS